MKLNRPFLLLLAILAGVGGEGCRRPTDRSLLRLGYFANLTHAPALTGVASGRFARALGAVRLETRVFSAGPEAMEALLAGALDAVYVGPSPVLTAWVASRGRALRVIAGATSGGAVFVVRAGSGIRGPADLHGRHLASPQLGNTQDVALRRYLAEHGLRTTDRGGDVTVTPLSNPDLLTQFRRGQLDGAWVPEPWGARLVAEAHAEILVDERDLWPDRSFVTTVLVARSEYLRVAPENVRRLLRAHAAEIGWLQAEREAGRDASNDAIARLVGRPLPLAVLRDAWGRLEFTSTPDAVGLRRNAEWARSLGFLANADTRGLVDMALFARVATPTNTATP